MTPITAHLRARAAMNYTRNANKTTTIECTCGYIATFEGWQWTCPECQRRYAYNGQKNGKPYLAQSGVPEHLARAATERRRLAEQGGKQPAGGEGIGL